jgi:di/tricarboxylate transporter
VARCSSVVAQLRPGVAGLLAAGAVVVTGVVTVEQADRAINWTAVVLVGAMIPHAGGPDGDGTGRLPVRDCRKLGLPLLLFLVVAVFLVPVLWRF